MRIGWKYLRGTPVIKFKVTPVDAEPHLIRYSISARFDQIRRFVLLVDAERMAYKNMI